MSLKGSYSDLSGTFCCEFLKGCEFLAKGKECKSRSCQEAI
nr:MAG TPA: hypothetical protein [Caudoviricetes sp.]